jgi:hypothetical protein
MLFGTMLHELFQEALRRGSFSRESMEQDVRVIVSRNIESLWTVGETEAAAEQKLLDSIDGYQQCLAKFIGQIPKVCGPQGFIFLVSEHASARFGMSELTLLLH